jgi:hypothetical protein
MGSNKDINPPQTYLIFLIEKPNFHMIPTDPMVDEQVERGPHSIRNGFVRMHGAGL